MPYLIDSDWTIDHLEGVPEATQLLAHLSGDGIAISIITYMEAYEGLARSPRREEAHARFRSFVDSTVTIPLTEAVARRCAELRQVLRAQGRRVSSRALDLIIAASALEHDLTLVTRNLDGYEDIPGLMLYRAD